MITHTKHHRPRGPGFSDYCSVVMVTMSVAMAVILRLLRLVDHGRLGGVGLQPCVSS
jgi:hypothetical protein